MQYVYRGTTVGWPGNDVLQQLQMTPVTSDPLVAALFAIENVRNGPAVVYVARKVDIAFHLGSPNVLAGIECEYAITVRPAEFIERFVVRQITINELRSVFEEIGVELPVTIASRFKLDRELESRPRLTEEQISAFDAMIMGAAEP
jgi:hypothetical protein